VAPDELNAPLGQSKAKKTRKLPVALPHLVAGVLGLFAIVVAAWAVFADDPLGGEPVAIVATKQPQAATPAKREGAGDAVNHARYDGPAEQKATNDAVAVKIVTPPPGSKTVTIIDGSSGKSQEVTIPGNAGGKAPHAPGEAKGQIKGEVKDAPDPKLSEPSRHGAIPVIGPGGARASVVFAQPRAIPADKKGVPQIAVIVGGLGISASGTADAFSKLPAPITFAIAPYGADLAALTARASAEKHEVLLQAPMEPFDYPNNDPGPQTLLTSLTPDQNIDRLHWMMSRFAGYVGIVGYMGARFTASEQSLSPVLRETAKRGLIYVDDGASARSVAAQIAGSQNIPFVKTDIVLDAVLTPQEIDRALTRLEMAAREHGSAVGIANALPATVDRIASWAKAVEGRGFVLVPVTMVAAKAKSS
jgi:polysaccharide deacetylase 2 family uncharacterized protein YibQ